MDVNLYKLLFESKMDRLCLGDGDLIVIRMSKEYRKVMTPEVSRRWMQMTNAAINHSLRSIGKKAEVMFLEEGINLERIPIEDMRKILASMESKHAT